MRRTGMDKLGLRVQEVKCEEEVLQNGPDEPLRYSLSRIHFAKREDRSHHRLVNETRERSRIGRLGIGWKLELVEGCADESPSDVL